MIAVAIDGPAGAGKSTIAKALSKELGFLYVDTGAMYRAIGLYAVENGVSTTDAGALAALLPDVRVSLAYREDGQHVFLNGRDVSAEIRAPEMGMAASDVSAMPEVRSHLLELQRDLARQNNVVMDGRDIGTVILPDASVKIFLTASVEERARRRYEEFVAKGEKVSYNEVLEDMKLRDHNDFTRSSAPLRQAENAVLVDTTGLTLRQSIDKMLDIVKRHKA